MDGQHYYTKSPSVASKPDSVPIRVRGVERVIQTDAGVFSKKGLDFGSRLLIETVQLSDCDSVVDLGCGYGVIAAVLGVVYPMTTWLLIDVNERAVQLAEANTAHLGNRRSALQSDGFIAAPDVKVQTVLLNPPIRAGKAVVYRLFEEAAQHITEDGAMWIVIHKKHGANSAKEKLATLFRDVSLVDREAGYHIFRCTQPCVG